MVERRIFLISFSLLKDLSALATVTGVVRRILGTPLFAGPPPIGGYGGRLLRRWTHSLLQIQRLQWSCGCAHKKTHSRCHYYYSRPECETKKKRFKFFFWKNWGIWRLIGGLAVDCSTLADLQRPNARSPTPIDVQRVDGTTRSEVDAESSWRRAVLPTDTVKSDKYYSYHAGLSYWTHLKLVQAVAAQKRTHYMISLKFLAENIDAFAIKWML